MCPACKQEGERINRYLGICRQEGCIAIAPDNTFKDIRKKNKRKMETLIIDQRKSVHKVAQTFWTDGSGKKIKGAGDMLQTGWATVLCDMLKTVAQKIKVTLQLKRTWGGGSKDLEIAILKALQETPEGGVAHIHTDNLGVILELKALVGDKTYK